MKFLYVLADQFTDKKEAFVIDSETQETVKVNPVGTPDEIIAAATEADVKLVKIKRNHALAKETIERLIVLHSFDKMRIEEVDLTPYL